MTKNLKLIPAILSENLDNYITKIKILNQIFNEIHLDISDHKYTNKITTPQPEEILQIALNNNSNIKFNIHLMLQEQMDYAEILLNRFKKNINYIYIDALFLKQKIKIKFIDYIVVNIRLEDSLDEYISIIKKFSRIQIMTVPIGMQGQNFDIKALDKIIKITNTFSNKEIHIDGGINDKTIKYLKNLPINVINIGSYFTNIDNLELLKHRINLIKSFIE